MLKEVRKTRQIPNEPFRRWFSDKTFDLIVWYDPDNTIMGFQLCYRKGIDEHALTWLRGKGFSHNRIDDGEGRPARHKMTPLLALDGTFEKNHVLALFENESKEIDPEIVGIVTEMIKRYPQASKRDNN